MLSLQMDVTVFGNSSSTYMTIFDTHKSDSSSERAEGVGAMGTARSLKVPPQDSGQKKMGEEGRRLKK